MDITPNLALPYILASQAQKHVTHNEAIRALDVLVQISVADRDLVAPPGSPAEGERHIVGAAATGAWAGHDAEIAAWQDAAWMFHAPAEGWIAWVADENALLAFDGAAWVTAAAAAALQNVPMLGVNATADATSRLALAAAASLFNHAGAGHQQKINKATAGDTASQLYQSNLSGRAELGLAGDDDFHLKVSADGSAWHEAVVVDRSTGFIGFGAAPTTLSRVTLKGDTTPKSQLKAWQVLDVGTGGGGILLMHNRSSGAPLSGDRLGYLFFGADNAGANANGSGITGYADDAWTFGSSHPSRVVFETTPAGSTARVERMRIDAAGNIGIGLTNPVCKLDVDGPARVKTYTVATVPAAGAGQIIYVSNEAGGAVLAFSDGTNWRRVTDRAVIS